MELFIIIGLLIVVSGVREYMHQKERKQMLGWFKENYKIWDSERKDLTGKFMIRTEKQHSEWAVLENKKLDYVYHPFRQQAKGDGDIENAEKLAKEGDGRIPFAPDKNIISGY